MLANSGFSYQWTPRSSCAQRLIIMVGTGWTQKNILGRKMFTDYLYVFCSRSSSDVFVFRVKAWCCPSPLSVLNETVSAHDAPAWGVSAPHTPPPLSDASLCLDQQTGISSYNTVCSAATSASLYSMFVCWEWTQGQRAGSSQILTKSSSILNSCTFMVLETGTKDGDSRLFSRHFSSSRDEEWEHVNPPSSLLWRIQRSSLELCGLTAHAEGVFVATMRDWWQVTSWSFCSARLDLV